MSSAEESGYLDWRCDCGEVRGSLSKRAHDGHLHAICYCSDCQAFQHALGRADAELNAQGGTEVVGVTPAAFVFSQGHEHVQALRLSPKGILRWHTACCKTPVGNTGPSHRLPYLGMVASTLLKHNDRQALEGLFGPIEMSIYGCDALNGPAPDAHPKVPLRTIPGLIGTVLKRVMRGEHRMSAFFNDDGTPIKAPQVLSKEARNALPPYQRASLDS